MRCPLAQQVRPRAYHLAKMHLPTSLDGSLGAWPTRIVLVVASLAGRPLSPARLATGRLLSHEQNTSTLTFVVYQRLNASAPNYSPNHGFEAGVFIQFILEHFADLPLQTCFAQDSWREHSPRLLDWLPCVSPGATFAPLTSVRLLRQGMGVWERASYLSAVAAPGLEAIVEQCWRNFLAAFNLSRLLPPRQVPTVGYYQGAFFLASREALRRNPQTAYAHAHAMAAGGDGRCHRGELEWQSLSARRSAYSEPHLVRDRPSLSKHTSAGAWEHLEHALVGSMGLHAPYAFDYCSAFVPRSSVCPGSPCRPPAVAQRVRLGAGRVIEPAPSYPLHAIKTPPDCEPNFRVKQACRTFEGAFFCGMEWDEWQLVNALVRPEDTVLELGARFGTTSCVLSKLTGNAGRVVAVEPDRSVHGKLIRNRDSHNCSFHIVTGVVGDAPLALSRRFGNYATQTQRARPGDRGVLPSISLAALEQHVGRPFTTLLLDCEGCIESFFVGSNRRLLSQLSMIIMEEDAPAQVNYSLWHERLRRHGFERVWRVRDSFAPDQSWSRNISHSAWRRGGKLDGRPTCAEYARSTGLSKRWLNCMDSGGAEAMVPGCHSDPCAG